MSHKIPRNEMYVNLPAHAIIKESINSGGGVSSSAGGGVGLGGGGGGGGKHRSQSNAVDQAIMLNNQQNSNRKSHLSKEMLYATPLRKSDRFKGREICKPFIDTEKINNIEQHCKDVIGGGGGGGNNNGDAEQILGERRILSFLKDTSQLQKKMEMHPGFPSSNFSCLAREEHFANLVHQNVVDQSDEVADGGEFIGSEEVEADRRLSNLESEMEKKLSPDKEVGDLIAMNVLPKMHSSVSGGVPYSGGLSKPIDDNYAIAIATATNSGLNLLDRPKPTAPSSAALIGGSINREWVLKKVAMCLEQRCAKQNPVLHSSVANESVTKMVGASTVQPVHPAHIGCIILGSNGSGKTTICQSISEGMTGTKGILNRKLLGCYFVNSQNPDCHNLSIFIRSMILQILSHSSYLTKEDYGTGSAVGFAKEPEEVIEVVDKPIEPQLSDDATKLPENRIVTDEEEMLISELKLSEKVAEFCAKRSPTKGIIRQQSEPISCTEIIKDPFGTHPSLSKSCASVNNECSNGGSGDVTIGGDGDTGGSVGVVGGGGESSSATVGGEQSCDLNNDSCSSDSNNCKHRPNKMKTSKIPVKIGIKSPKRNGGNSSGGGGGGCGGDSDGPQSASPSKTDGKKNNNDNDENENEDDEEEATTNDVDETIVACDEDGADNTLIEGIKSIDLDDSPKTIEEPDFPSQTEEQIIVSSPSTQTEPAPLPPKTKSCRTQTADEYYEMLISNPEILESLCADNIEKNPDDCFKKSILFPLLELTPPKQALLLLVDSIDENYINEGNLISTLKGRNSTKSRNIAELLSNHIHLFPKWLFLVCTAKKQNKHITKIFSGFKKITLDDLRKSHVVKDVQEYIINRLNSDFKGSINLTKEVIESLNQLYIKSNGCILYLQKVLDGIKESFFSFREIKLIPCTLNGLYLYICQKSFNKKQYSKIRPILNILLACSGYVESFFVLNCLRAHNYQIDSVEFDKRLEYMRNVLVFRGNKMKIFHNSFCDWLVDVKFSTKKFLCDVNEGHVMISMYYTLISDTLCPNLVRRYIYHLIKAGEYLTTKSVNLDLILILLESRTNLSDCFYTNLLNCCDRCEDECKNDANFLAKTKEIIEKFLNNELNEEFSSFLCDFFKPNLPTDAKTLKLLIETGINNADCQLSYDSSQNSPVLTDKSQNIDSELAELLISSERSCHQEVQRAAAAAALAASPRESLCQPELNDDGKTAASYARLGSLAECHNLELHKGKALIHILANEGNHVLLERALKACKDPIDLEIEDTSGQTALNIAARNGHLEIVKLLLNLPAIIAADSENGLAGNIKEVNVNHADRDGWTPLRSASWGGHTEVVKLLIEQSKCAIDLADKEERTALRAAAWSGHEDILKILINAGANVNSVDKQGRTSLIAASYMGHYEIVEILLENGANVNHLDVDGRSALCVAALCGTSGYSKVISCLLEHGANTDQLDNDGMSPLLVSSFEGNNEVCELLLENGADPDLADFMGRTPLWAACTAGHAIVVKLLLFWGCGIDCMDSEGRTVLSIAAAQGNLETVRQLLDRGLDETHRDNAGWTPLHYAAFEGYPDICTQLVESGAKIDECDNEGKTALHLAAQEGRDKVIDALLSIHNGCVDLRAHDGKTSFRLACIEGHIECINTLLKYGCDVNLKDADSRTTLYILALENKIKIVKYLLEHSNINVNIPDSEGRTALHVAAWQGHLDMVKLLISQGHADVNAMDLDCRTPLHSCAWQGNHEVMEILLFCGALADHACKQGATALGISAQEGHEQCVAHLLQYGANPYKSDHCGRTPIKLAAKSNRNNVLRILENYTKNDANFDQKHYLGHIQKSPDKPILTVSNQNPNLLVPNIAGGGIGVANSVGSVTNNSNSLLNATNSTQSSNNFYENTMHSDTSSLQKRKSVISSQSTGSSNNEVPLSFTQQLQRQTRHNSRHSQIVQPSSITNVKYSKGSQKHSQILPNVDEYQTNLASQILSNDADLSDMGCMSPLYATPPHSPCSDISSPGNGGQPPSLPRFDESGGGSGGATNSTTLANQIKMDHFARDTHMRIILGNANKESNQSKSSKRSGIATNPAVRMIRNRFDSAAQLIRRTNNILSSNSNSQGSSSIGVKSGTFQWRKESQM